MLEEVQRFISCGFLAVSDGFRDYIVIEYSYMEVGVGVREQELDRNYIRAQSVCIVTKIDEQTKVTNVQASRCTREPSESAVPTFVDYRIWRTKNTFFAGTSGYYKMTFETL